MLKITRGGQITLPKGLREELCLEEGDYVTVVPTGRGTVELFPMAELKKRLEAFSSQREAPIQLQEVMV